MNETNYELNTEDFTTPNQCTSEKDEAIENLDLPTTITGKQKTSARELVANKINYPKT